MPEPLTFRDLRRRLLDHDPRFEFRAGKGSEIVLSHPEFRAACSLPHHGDGDTVSVLVLRKIERDFGLPRGFFDPRHRPKAPAAPAPAPEFVRHVMPPLTCDPFLDFICIRDGVVDTFIPSELDLHGWVNVHRIGRCPVCNEPVQENGLPCFICGTNLDPSIFAPPETHPGSEGANGSGRGGARGKKRGRGSKGAAAVGLT